MQAQLPKIAGAVNIALPHVSARGVDGTSIAVAVLTRGDLAQCGEPGDVAVYIGIGEPEHIIRFGHKLTWREATAFWPHLREEDYRG